MRNNEEFDRLARQKMNEREFAFDQSQWLKAQKLIAHKRSNRGYLYFLWLLIPITAVCVWLIVGNGNNNQASQPYSPIPSNNTSENFTTSNQPAAIAKDGSALTETSSEALTTIQAKYETTTTTKDKESVTNFTSDSRNSNSTSNDQKVSDKKEKSNSLKSNAKSNNIKPSHPTFNNIDTHDTAAIDSKNSNLTIEASNQLEPSGIDRRQFEMSPSINTMISSPPSIGDQPDVNNELNMLSAENTISDKSKKQVTIIKSIDGKFSEEDDGLMRVNIIPSNSIRLWKLSLLAGIWNNQTSITGLPREAWMDHTKSNTSNGFGAEMIRNYHHFGWGTGLHYSNYRENLDVGQERANLSQTYKYWYLSLVDTSVWIVTDSIANGNGYTYLGYSEDRTIQTIASAYGTRYTNTLVREARQIQNSVSYFEIPLLADIHTGKGNWLIGLRGGPSIGRLIERRGALPNTEGNGYQELSNTTLQQWVPGYNLRAYVDYKLGMHWSVGLQGGKRGIIGNTLTDDAYTRKTSAWGGMMSVSYLLREEHVRKR